MTASSRGILYPARLPEFHRLPPPATVGHLVRWFWIPEWDIEPGRISRQHVVSYPASNLVVEPALVGLAGPTTKRSHRDLSGRGWAVGALLRPAAVPAFTADPGALCDRYLVLELPDLQAQVAASMHTEPSVGRRQSAVQAFAGWLADRVPQVTEEALLANAMVDLIEARPDVLRLEDVATGLAVSTRTLQRLAKRYVGVAPAAIIRRRRLQEAAERLRSEPDSDLAAIAAELGYSDHAHMANDFRTVLNFTPSAYRREAR